MSADPKVILTIIGMALATYFTRAAGYWWVRRATPHPRVMAALGAVPGSVLAALIAPVALATGVAETIAAVVTIGLALRLPTLVAVIGGTATVAVLRGMIG